MQTYIGLLLILIIILYVGWNLRKIYPKTFNRPFPKEVYPSKSELRFSMVSIVVISAIMFSLSTEYALKPPKIPVSDYNENYTDLNPLIKDFEKVEIKGVPYLYGKEVSLKSQLISVLCNEDKAVLTNLVILVICVVATIGFWNFDFKDPFGTRLSRTFYQIGSIVIAYGIASHISEMMANSFTTSTTNNKFGMRFSIPFMTLFKVWFGVILMRIGQILRNAEKLREEQALTI